MTTARGAKKDSRGTRWFYSQLPVDVATGPVGTLIQLYILELHGTVIDVGLAITLYNAVSIPAAVIWGYVTDRFQSRKTILVLSCVAVSANLVLLPVKVTDSRGAFTSGLKLEDFRVQHAVHSLAVDVKTHRVYTPEQEEDGKPVARMVVYEAVIGQ